jgi:hypothetical protein
MEPVEAEPVFLWEIFTMEGGEQFMYIKRLATGLGIISVLMASAFMPVLAADTGTVNATVTGQVISVSVSPSSFDYGVVPFSTSNTTVSQKDIGTTGLNTGLTATNDGNVAEDLKIQGADATGGSTNWALVSSLGATVNQYVHAFNAGTTLSSPTALTTGLQSLGAGNVAASGSQAFVLQITMPLSGSDPAQHSTTTTVVATAH